ncbi:hypothetical protein [Pseudohoeflea coraliihabitans]|uniref:Uncharacterized protein n=1 Tax=Pseudohoeflea coraliihabitans TaxID=2860393 RepID=A0ABS6WI79_9HYPH|nr:hypothetical protein [Pseudohoeflea sp. DP4N28-3]MBW3095663.1 hypothetical protein [Pseudohoeflea sp. DP4N28-3]
MSAVWFGLASFWCVALVALAPNVPPAIVVDGIILATLCAGVFSILWTIEGRK